MAGLKYNVVFSGRTREGLDAAAVQSRLAAAFGISERGAARILRSPGLVLKKNLDESSARRWQSALRAAGLETVLEKTPVPASETGTAGDGPPAADTGATAAEFRAADSPQPVVAFAFLGRGAEYFRIWLVNVLLSVITFGIYSAWAKVRRKQYFYGNTRLAGAAFEYLADPLKILKGRAAVTLFFIVYSSLTQFMPWLGGPLSLLAIPALPWLVVRSLAFNAYNSAYRNIRFGFSAGYREAFKIYLLWPAAALLSLGVLGPYAYFRQKQFLVTHSRYGGSFFTFTAAPGEYYQALLMLLLPLAAAVLLCVLTAAAFPLLLFFLIPVAYLYIFAALTAKMTNLFYNRSRLEGNRFAADFETRSYALLVAGNTVATALTLGLFHAWAAVRTMRYKADHLKLHPSVPLDSFVAGKSAEVSALGEEMSDFLDFDFGL